MTRREKILRIAASAALAGLFVFASVEASSTIGLNVSTGGTLSVTGNSHMTADLFVYGGDLALGTGSATTTLTVDSTGNLGVGTVSPKSALYVIGAGTFSTDLSLNGGDLNISDGISTSTLTSSGGNLGVGSGSTTPSALFSISATNTATNNNAARFLVSTSTATATSTAFIIDSNGRVGVRTSSPTAGVSFEVAGIASTTKLIVGGNQTTSLISNILFGTCSYNEANIQASSTKSTNCTGATGVDSTYNVFVTPVWLENGLVFTSASATAADTIQVTVLNTANASGTGFGVGIDPVTRSWYWMAIK